MNYAVGGAYCHLRVERQSRPGNGLIFYTNFRKAGLQLVTTKP